jgi:glycosyltransferase involved in cell wall biosynthesis
MRILQVVTYISKDSSFGGPAQVAQNILTEIISDHKSFPPNKFNLFRSFSLFAKLGFAGIVNIRVFLKFYRIRRNFDIFHIHLARDLITLPLALMCALLKLPYVLQCHGMIDPSNRLSARILDKFATRFVMRKSFIILSLSEEEDKNLIEVEANIVIQRFINAAKVGPKNDRENRIVFVGRLSQDKRPEILVKAGQILLQKGHDLIFDFIGPDAGSLEACTRNIAKSQIGVSFVFHGPLTNPETIAFLSRSRILVLPSPRDRFPLAVVESLSVGTPVVISSGNGIAPLISEYNAGIVSTISGEAVADGIACILKDYIAYEVKALELFKDIFDLESNTKKLMSIYAHIMTLEKS